MGMPQSVVRVKIGTGVSHTHEGEGRQADLLP